MGLISSHDCYPKWKGLGIFVYYKPFSHFISHNYEEASEDQSYKGFENEYSSLATTFNTLLLFPAGQSEYLLEAGERFLCIWWVYSETNLNSNQPWVYI